MGPESWPNPLEKEESERLETGPPLMLDGIPRGNMKEPVLTRSKRVQKPNLQAAPIQAPDLGFLGAEKVVTR